MFIDIILIIAGLVLLFLGGEGLVRGAVALATKFGLSTLLVSLVVVGFGTSVPELLVSVQAAMKGTPDIALGNVVGSNIANVLLILGTAAVLGPVVCAAREIKRDVLAVIVASLMLAGFSFTHDLSWVAGAVMVVTLVSYLFYCYRAERKSIAAEKALDHLEEDIAAPPADSTLKAMMFTLAGLVMLVAGANFLVDGAVSIARSYGISEAVIGLTLVALGTSLPELATAFVAALRKHADVVIGNILGSNLFNVLAILGITGIITPIPFAGRIADIDVWVMLATALVLAAIIFTMGRMNRVMGAGFLTVYVGYCAWLFVA